MTTISGSWNCQKILAEFPLMSRTRMMSRDVAGVTLRPFPPNIKLRWIFKNVDSNQVHLLSEALRLRSAIAPGNPQLDFTLAGLLAARGIADPDAAERFVFPSLSHLHSPYPLRGMISAVARLDVAI